jgi:peptidoglycan/LPS O-acetylase OafA/YrhL
MFEPVASKERVLFQDYRPDIAGLRAIAVIAATLFHARFQHIARQLYKFRPIFCHFRVSDHSLFAR